MVKRNIFWITIILVLISTIIKIIAIHKQCCWIDEAYTYWYSRQKISDILFFLPKFEVHFPFYYLLINFWAKIFPFFDKCIGDRYFSLAASLLLVPISYQIFSLFRKKFGADKTFYYCLILLFLLNNHLTWYSAESRPYILYIVALAIFIVGILSVLYVPSNFSNKNFTLGSILTLYAHPTGFIYIIFPLLLVIFSKNFLKRFFSTNRKIFLLWLISSVPLFIFLVYHSLHWTKETWIPEPSLYSLVHIYERLLMIENIKIYFINFLGPIGNVTSVLVINLLTILTFLGIYFLWRKDKTLTIMLLLISLGPLIMFIISLFGPNILIFRCCLPVLVPIFIFSSFSISIFLKKITNTNISCLKHSNILILTVFFCLLLVSSINEIRWKQKEPWDKVAQEISKRVKNYETCLLLLPNSLELPLNFYLENDNLIRVIPLPDRFPALNYQFYPSGLMGVPGITNSNFSEIIQKFKKCNHLLYLTRREDLFDPFNYLRKYFNKNCKYYEYTKLRNIYLTDYKVCHF